MEIIRPNADGDTIELNTTSGGGPGTNHDEVDDISPDDDATYNDNANSQTWETDLYHLAAHSVGSGTINSVKVYAEVKGGGTGNGLKIKIKSGTTTNESAEKAITTSYATYDNTWTTNPDTSSAFTWAEIDALQAGININGIDKGATSRVTQVYVEVTYVVATYNYFGYNST